MTAIVIEHLFGKQEEIDVIDVALDVDDDDGGDDDGSDNDGLLLLAENIVGNSFAEGSSDVEHGSD